MGSCQDPLRSASHQTLTDLTTERNNLPSADESEEVIMATKDKNSKRAMAKKPAQKTLREKREAKKNKK